MTQRDRLHALINAALNDGWASTTCLRWSGVEVERQVRLLRHSIVPTRGGQELKLEVLQPTEKAHAHPNSLSALYGQGPQPLHTDGAHQDEPPEVILLTAQEPSAVPTLLWRLADHLPKENIHDLHEGPFTIRGGRRTFLAPAVVGHGRRTCVRYDPGCMTPADGRARRVAELIEARVADASHFDWQVPNTVLAINNRQVLHARGDAR